MNTRSRHLQRRPEQRQLQLRWPRSEPKPPPAPAPAPAPPKPIRKPAARRSTKVPHTTRPDISGPAHVVLRVCRNLPTLRSPKVYRVLERAFRDGKSKKGFQLVEFSIQHDHLHLVVEADHRRKLTRGIQGLMIRIAKRLNRFWRRKVGRVFEDRYFALAVATRRQLWATLRYVLHNGRKHGVWRRSDRPDPYSSGKWFRHWQERLHRVRRPTRPPPVEPGQRFELHLMLPLWLGDTPGPRH